MRIGPKLPSHERLSLDYWRRQGIRSSRREARRVRSCLPDAYFPKSAPGRRPHLFFERASSDFFTSTLSTSISHITKAQKTAWHLSSSRRRVARAVKLAHLALPEVAPRRALLLPGAMSGLLPDTPQPLVGLQPSLCRAKGVVELHPGGPRHALSVQSLLQPVAHLLQTIEAQLRMSLVSMM